MSEETRCPLCGMFPDAEPIQETLAKLAAMEKDRDSHKQAGTLLVAIANKEIEDLKKLLCEVEHYVRYGDGQMQGTRARPEQNSPSVETERGRILRLLHPYRKKE